MTAVTFQPAEPPSRFAGFLQALPEGYGAIGLAVASVVLIALCLRLIANGGVLFSSWERREFMNSAERRLFVMLVRAMPDYVVLAQTSMAAIIQPTARGQGFMREFRRIMSQRVDFALMNPSTGHIDFIVELDGATHQAAEQKQRDAFRDRAFAKAGIATLRFRGVPSVEFLRDRLSELHSSRSGL